MTGLWQVPLSSEIGCKTCLNSGILYLHRLIGTDNNVALSVCRDAVFATLSNQGDSLSGDDDMASCFFGVEGLRNTNGIIFLHVDTRFYTPDIYFCLFFMTS